MLIYNKNNFLYCFIHIPSTAGKTIRNNIKKESHIIKEYIGCKDKFDYSHISYALRNKFCNFNKVLYHTYVRNPYQRIISSYFYKNPNNSIVDFRIFIKRVLRYMDLSQYNLYLIYYYPCYFFIYETINKLPEDIIIEKIEDHKDIKINQYNLTTYYDQECISIINNIYEKDFELFNYEKKVLVYF